MGDWLRDDLPDLLWPALVLAHLGTPEAIRFVKWQGAVQRDLAERGEAGFVADCLDGRLTGLERLTARFPEAEDSVVTRAVQMGLLPHPVAGALASYPSRPAEWLASRETSPSGGTELALLSRAILEAATDGHREAVIKCLPIWSSVQAGMFRTSTETSDLLELYPTDAGTRSAADSVVRASWGARKGLLLYEDAHHFADSIAWSKTFWTHNSSSSSCSRRQVPDAAEQRGPNGSPNEADAGGDSTAPTGAPEAGAHFRRFAMDLFSSYVEALEGTPANGLSSEQREVTSSLVARAGREVITALGAPDLWCMEHGSHVIRTLVESRIYVQWMSQQEPSIYRVFQDYGAGKAKLYARIMDEVPPEARQPGFEQAVTELRELSHNDDILDHRVVDTRDSFAGGKSIRSMADDCGLLDLYRQAYSIASGVSHSEWWSLETHAMERCSNVLHGGHFIPTLSLNSGGNVDLARSWVDQLYALIIMSLSILDADDEAVRTAFDWLTADEAPSAPEDEEGASPHAGEA